MNEFSLNRQYSVETFIDKIHLDAANVLRTSTKHILGNYIQHVDNLPNKIERVGTGIQTYSNGVVSMSVTVGQYAIAQTYARHPYFAGKSQLFEVTFNDMLPTAGIVKRQGYFSSNTVAPYDSNKDGVWFESDDTTFSVVVSKDGSETRVSQSTWNVDKLDGTGKSGVTLNLTNFNIFAFDFLYLGGSAVRVFCKVGNELILVHIYTHSNNSTSTFVLSPSKPYRAEIRSTSGTGSMGQICCSISTEGVLELLGDPFHVTGGVNFINCNTIGTTYLLKAIRLQSGFSPIVLSDFGFTINATTADEYIWSLRRNPTIAGTALTWSNVSNTYIQEANGEGEPVNPSTNTVTGGYIVAQDYGLGAGGGLLNTNQLLSDFKLGTSINGTADILALCLTPVTSNIDAKGAIRGKQF